MNIQNKIFALLALLLFLAAVSSAGETKVIRFGIAPGPYGDLIKKGIQPSLEKKGYKVEYVTFQDWVQPDLALNNKETDANLFQHVLYLRKFSADHNLQLSELIKVPTAGLGLYSSKIKSLNQLKKGDEVTLALDPTNLARSLRFLNKAGLITLKTEVDQTKATLHDIASNPRGLKFIPTEAAQLPRTLQSSAIAVVPGNYAISAGLKLSEALILEELTEDTKNIIAVRTENLNASWAKDIVEVVQSKAFRDAVEDHKNIFYSFQKPDWYKAKWNVK
ncbi:MAG: MetQ/NlpA family ABC transporter substrate-binding protein [Fibrobacteraceae bacterium]